MSSWTQSLDHAVSNMKSNRQVFFASVGSIGVALTILGLFLFVYINLSSSLVNWSREVQLTVYLQDGVGEETKGRLENLFNEHPEVGSFTFVSRETAWKSFQDMFAGESQFLDGLDFNPLPASYQLQFDEGGDRINAIREFATVVQEVKGVESVEFGEQWVSRFEAFLIFLRVFLFVLGGLLAFGTVFIISNTIKLSVISRKDEIELMLLIGATEDFIRRPYFMEGILNGIAGALLSLGVVKALHLYLELEFQGSLTNVTRGFEIQFLSAPYISLVFVASIFAGWLGSYLSIQHFLKTYEK